MRLSVIVCTYNRAYAILDCLNSIHASLMHAAPIAAEIVVVDNASIDNTNAIITDWARSSQFPVQIVRELKQGIAAARNCGMRTSKGEFLIFTDDDCRLSKTYILDALKYDVVDTEMILRGGRVELGDPTDFPITIKTDNKRMRWNRSLKSANYENLGNCFHGCNMTMRRSLFEKLGYFDEFLGAGALIPAGEDTDYIFRAYCADITIEYVPDMTVFHFHGRKNLTHGYKLFSNYMIGSGALYAKYLFQEPNLCRQFYWDLKGCFSEIFRKRPDYLKETGFTYRDKIRYTMWGAIRYMIARLKTGF